MLLAAVMFLASAAAQAQRDTVMARTSDYQFATINRQLLITTDASSTDSGLAWDRHSTHCGIFFLELPESVPSYFVLSGDQRPGRGTKARTIRMDSSRTSGYIIILGSPKLEEGWVEEIPIIARPAIGQVDRFNNRCPADRAPLPTTTTYSLAITIDEPWHKQDRDVEVISRPFLKDDINADRATALTTGLAFHRSSTFCRYIDVALDAATPSYIELQKLDERNLPDGAPANSYDGLRMLSSDIKDQPVRLQFSANRRPVDARVVSVTVVATRARNVDEACKDIETSSRNLITTPGRRDIRLPEVDVTVAYTLTILETDSYAAGANDTAVTRAFTQAELLAADTPTFTGGSFQQIAASCSYIDAELAADAQDVFALAAAGRAPASRLTGVEQDNASDDHNISLVFKSRARVEALEHYVDVVVSPAASCSTFNAPDSTTLTYRLTVNDSAPAIAVNTGVGYLLAGSTLRHTEIIISVMDPGPVGGGSAHPNLSIASDDSGLFTIADAPGSRDYDLRVGELVLKSGLTVSDTTVSYTVTVAGADSRDASLTTAALPVTIHVAVPPERVAAADAGVYATRMIGLGVMDAVLERPHSAGGASASAGLLEMLAAKESGLESGEIDLREFLDGQSFSMPLQQVGGGSFVERAGFWGQAESYSVGGESDAGLVYDGSLFSTNIGADMLLNNGMLAGFSYGIHDYSSTYSDSLVSGEYNLELDIMHPYAAVDVDGGWLAVAIGFGKGEVDLNRKSGPLHLHPRRDDGQTGGTREAEYRGYAIGYSRDLNDVLRVRGSGASSDLDVTEEAGDGAGGLDVESSALRLALAYTSEEYLMQTFPLLPVVELAYAGYWGDAPSDDSSFIIAAGAKYAGEGPTTFSGTYRYAATGDSQSGLEVNLRVEPGRGGLGLGLGFSPSWGLEGDGADLISEITNPQPLAARGDVHGVRAKADLSYGMAVRGGLLTPYGSWSLAGDDELGVRVRSGVDKAWRLGWRPGAGDELKIEYRLGN